MELWQKYLEEEARIINPKDLNDDRLGDALEKLGVLDYHKLYSEICMRAIEIHNVKTKALHVAVVTAKRGFYTLRQLLP